MVWPVSGLLFVAAVFLAAGCNRSKLPDYAKPTGQSMDPQDMEGRDRIAYRKLKPDDFLAKEPPENMRQYAERMGAVTCAHLLSFPDPRYTIRETPQGFEGRYENLDFVALMDRECSWWNPQQADVPVAYVLQHEQIHFALAEIAARRLDDEAKELMAELQPRASSQKEVEEILIGTVQDLLKKAIKGLLAENQRFDEDTSNTYAPEKQQKWYDEVMEALGD